MTPAGKGRDADTALSDEAIDWLVRLHSGRATPADHAAFASWRRQSGEHEAAAREAETIWQGLGIAGDRVRRSERKARLTRRAVLGGAIVAGGGILLERSGLVGPHLFADHVTGIGEQRSVTLADGSSVSLNAGSALSVDFAATERLLTLHHGQAVFAVAHDPARPFIVEAGSGRTRAVGTAFDIDIRPNEVAVTVLEGIVDIATDSAPAASVTAGADERVRYGASGQPSDPEAVDSEAGTAWRRGKLIFDRRPLGDVVAELERYRPGRIVIADGSLRLLEVTGVFDLSEPEAVLNTIEDTLPVHVTRLPFVTVLR